MLPRTPWNVIFMACLPLLADIPMPAKTSFARGVPRRFPQKNERFHGWSASFRRSRPGHRAGSEQEARPLLESPGVPPLAFRYQTRLSPSDAADYDEFVARARGGAWAQLRDFAPLATADRPFAPSFFLARDAGRVVASALVLRGRFAGLPMPWAQIERGPVVDSPDDLARVLPWLRRALLRRGILRLQIMPYFDGADAEEVERVLRSQGFRLTQAMDGAHARTLRMSLEGARDEDVLSGSVRKTLRYELKQASKAGVRVRRLRGPEVSLFGALHRETMGGQGKSGKAERFIEELGRATLNSEAIAVFHAGDSEPLGAVVLARCGARATLVLGATASARRPFSKMAPPLVEGLSWARSAGCTQLDLGGIPAPEDTDPKRRAIAAFKLGFTRDCVSLVREHARWL